MADLTTGDLALMRDNEGFGAGGSWSLGWLGRKRFSDCAYRYLIV